MMEQNRRLQFKRSEETPKYDVIRSINNKDEAKPFTDEQIKVMFENPNIFNKYLKPFYPNGTINHQFLKGFRVKANDATIHIGEYEVIGFYFCNIKKNLSFAVKPVEGSEHSSSWWFEGLDNDNKTFIPNTNIIFTNKLAQKCYLKTDYSPLYDLINRNAYMDNIKNIEELRDIIKYASNRIKDINMSQKITKEMFLEILNLSEDNYKNIKKLYIKVSCCLDINNTYITFKIDNSDEAELCDYFEDICDKFYENYHSREVFELDPNKFKSILFEKEFLKELSDNIDFKVNIEEISVSEI